MANKLEYGKESIICVNCEENFFFDSSMIKKGRKYGVRCPKCGTEHLRKKLIPSVLERFEEETGFKLPLAYELLMTSFGSSSHPQSVQMYRLDQKPLIDADDDDRPDDSYIVIGRMSNGDPVLCKSGEETISIFNHEAGIIEEDEVYPNLFVFLETMKREENA